MFFVLEAWLCFERVLPCFPISFVVKIPSVFSLRFGWYGFNPGSTLTMKSGSDGALAAQVAMNTTLAAATGGITVFLLRDWAAVRRVEAKKLVNLVNHRKRSDMLVLPGVHRFTM